jgi:hypothetical protein
MHLKNGKLFTSNFVGTGPSSYEKRIYRAAVSQTLRNTAPDGLWHTLKAQSTVYCNPWYRAYTTSRQVSTATLFSRLHESSAVVMNFTYGR